MRLKYANCKRGGKMTLGEMLKTIREQHKMSQTEFAEICMRTRDWQYLIETDSNRTKVTKQDLIMLSEGLNEPLLKTIAVGMTYEELQNAIKF